MYSYVKVSIAQLMTAYYFQHKNHKSSFSRCFQAFPGVSRRCSHLCILQRPQVQQVKVARHRRAEWQEGAELWQLAVAWGNHGDWRVAEGERGQVGEQ